MSNKVNKITKTAPKTENTAPVAAPAAEATKTEKPAIQKTPKTVLESGLSYSLVSRLMNACDKDTLSAIKATEGTTALVDGRGETHQVPSVAIVLAEKLGAKFLASVKSAYLRPRLVIDVKAQTCVLDESKVQTPFIKQQAKKEEAPAKVAKAS